MKLTTPKVIAYFTLGFHFLQVWPETDNRNRRYGYLNSSKYLQRLRGDSQAGAGAVRGAVCAAGGTRGESGGEPLRATPERAGGREHPDYRTEHPDYAGGTRTQSLGTGAGSLRGLRYVVLACSLIPTTR